MIWTSQKLPALESSEKHGSGLQEIIENTRSTHQFIKKTLEEWLKLGKWNLPTHFIIHQFPVCLKNKAKAITQDIRELNLNSHMDKWRRSPHALWTLARPNPIFFPHLTSPPVSGKWSWKKNLNTWPLSWFQERDNSIGSCLQWDFWVVRTYSNGSWKESYETSPMSLPTSTTCCAFWHPWQTSGSSGASPYQVTPKPPGNQSWEMHFWKQRSPLPGIGTIFEATSTTNFNKTPSAKIILL